jgi:hypothetical protein
MASFTPAMCTFGDIQRASILQKAFEDIAGQLGILLTEYGKQSLYGVSNTEIAAETSLSKGIVAQKNNHIVEALSYYYNAASFSPAMPEVKGRISNLSSSVSSGSLGENVRNLIAWRNAWNDVLKECDSFLENHIPFEIVYDTELKQVGNINYDAGTIDLSFSLMTKPSDGFKMIDDVLKGLKKTGRQEEWGFQFWPFGIHELHGRKYYYGEYDKSIESGLWGVVYNNPKGISADKILKANAALVNDRGKIISTIEINLICRMGAIIFEKIFSEPYDQKKILVRPKTMKQDFLFKGVDADDITDVLTIKLTKIDGIDIETAISNGYIKISTGRVYKSVSFTDFLNSL